MSAEDQPTTQPELKPEDYGLKAEAAELFSTDTAIGKTFQQSVLTTHQLQEEQSVLEDTCEQNAQRVTDLLSEKNRIEQTIEEITTSQQQALENILDIGQQIKEQQELQAALLAPLLPQETQPEPEASPVLPEPFASVASLVGQALEQADVPIPTRPEVETIPEIDEEGMEIAYTFDNWQDMLLDHYSKELEQELKGALRALARKDPDTFDKFKDPTNRRLNFLAILNEIIFFSVEELNSYFSPTDSRTFDNVTRIVSLIHRHFSDDLFIPPQDTIKAVEALRSEEHRNSQKSVLSITEEFLPRTNIVKPAPEPEKVIFDSATTKPEDSPQPLKLTLEKPEKFPTQDQQITQLMSYTIDQLIEGAESANTPGIDWPILTPIFTQLTRIKATYVDGIIDEKEIIKVDRNSRDYAKLKLIDVIKLISLRQYWGSHGRIPKKINRKLLDRFDNLLQNAINHFVACKQKENTDYQPPHWLA